MASPIHSYQPSFTAGELSPSLYGRVDLEKFRSALRTGKNGWVHPQGGFSNRPGTRFMGKAKYDYMKCRLIPFEFSTSQAYILEFGNLYIRFWKSSGQVMSLSVPYEISTPYLEADLPDLKIAQSADTIYITHQDHAPATLVRYADTNWVLSAFLFKNGPYMPANSDTTFQMKFSGVSNILQSTDNLFQAGHVGAWFRLRDRVQNQQTINTLDLSTTIGGVIQGYKQWKLTTTGTWKGVLQIQISFDSSFTSPSTISYLASNNDANFNTYGVIPYDFPVYMRVYAGLYSGSGPVNVTLSCDDFQYAYDLKVTALIDAKNVYVVQDTIAGGWPDIVTGWTTDWAEGSWSSVRGWPSVVAFYQDRLCFSSSVEEPIAVWMSQTGDYPNFAVSDPMVDSDSISVNLPARKLNKVQNLLSMIKLLAITSSGEASIGPGASGILAPTSIEIKNQGYRGGSSVSMVVIGNQGLYVQPMGTVIRSLGYQFYTDSFSGDNLSLLSNHLFTNYTILDLAYQQEPDSLVWAVRSDGVLLSMTYLPEQQVIGWTWHDTQGTFESIATIPNVDHDELWMSVHRDIGTCIERMEKRLPTDDIADAYHVDCGLTYDGAEVDIVTGLDHLNGQIVMALADGYVQGPFTVSGGQIVLSAPASKVHVGLGYTFDAETLNFERTLQDGTSQGRRQRVAQLVIRFLNSVGGSVGPDFTHMHPIIQRQTIGAPIPLFTGDYRIPVAGSWQNNGRMAFRQSNPLPVTILSIMPITEESNL
jgi:hypothetical protein